ncbi:NAD(P)H-binding protein [Pontibacillus salicampi]|uniref:NAD(P)H-binding protein n=1 Tax=Pontibacillus salicampi TaxID=1449801 RepID=A0ABV6LT16_9BACI
MMKNQETKKRPVVALTGASGYIGHHLVNKLTEHADVVALSRNINNKQDTAQVTWRSCDLFSMSDAEKALEGVDFAVYLVHSMKPSAKLTQGSFENMDVILADNFAQAAKKQRLKQIVYLSGIIPENEKLSRHLSSRLEVENILRAYGTPVTTIRAGLIVGPKGSSFPILKKLVKRLPVMVLPKWTRTKTHPIALPDVLTALDKSIGNQTLSNRAIDIGGPEIMSYKEMMRQTTEVMGLRRKMINVPFLTVKLSRLWVSLTTNSPKEMVYPLIESLTHPMTAKPEHMDEEISFGKITFKQSVHQTLQEEKQNAKERKSVMKPNAPSIQQDVRSVQRIPLPAGKDADWVSNYYMIWLHQLIHPFLKIEVDETNEYSIQTRLLSLPLLTFRYSEDRSTVNRSLYYITGGAFENKAENKRGRLEFRRIPHSDECIVAIHDYLPSLPWFIYRYTQAKAHLWVMYQFHKHLMKLEVHPPNNPILVTTET